MGVLSWFKRVGVSVVALVSIVSEYFLHLTSALDHKFLPVTMYARAAASDYDDWGTKYHNPGWTSADLIPLLQKVSKGNHILMLPLRLSHVD